MKIKNPKGFGDTVANIFHFFMIDILVEKIVHLFGKKDCGCTRRQQKLNELISYKKERFWYKKKNILK